MNKIARIAVIIAGLFSSCKPDQESLNQDSTTSTKADSTITIQVSRRDSNYELIVGNLLKPASIFINDDSFNTANSSGKHFLDKGILKPGENKISLISSNQGGPDTVNATVFIPYEVSYTILQKYPHNRSNFTQGLFIDNNVLFESTGLKGHSKIVKYHIDKQSIRAFDSVQNIPDIFGEGIALYNGNLYQLTWQNHIAYQYDPVTLKQKNQFNYPVEGWGLCTGDGNLIASDGTPFLYFIDPLSFTIVNKLAITEAGTPVPNINELESINSLVVANVWQTDQIIFIDKRNGTVVGYADFSKLTAENKAQFGEVDFLNGIAYDPLENTLLVTGKLWGWIYKIRLNDEFKRLIMKN